MSGIRLLASPLRSDQQHFPAVFKEREVRSQQFTPFIDRGVFENVREKDRIKLARVERLEFLWGVGL
jgi:hypothetical protein